MVWDIIQNQFQLGSNLSNLIIGKSKSLRKEGNLTEEHKAKNILAYRLQQLDTDGLRAAIHFVDIQL